MFNKKFINEPSFGKYEFSQKKQNILTRILARFVLILILALISKSDIEDNKSRSHLDARDWRRFILSLVSRPEIKCQEFSVSSRCARLNQRNSHSRLENEKMTLADLW